MPANLVVISKPCNQISNNSGVAVKKSGGP